MSFLILTSALFILSEQSIESDALGQNAGQTSAPSPALPSGQDTSSPTQGFLDDDNTKAEPANESRGASQPAQPVVASDSSGEQVLAWYRSLSVRGFIEAGYGLVLPAVDHGFFVGEAELDVEREFYDVARLRFDMNLAQPRPGRDIPAWFGTGAALTVEQVLEQGFVEAYPLGDQGPRLRLGKYNANIGFERQDAIDRSLISRSLVFSYGTPINFTGLAVVSPQLFGLTLAVHAAFNGWDRDIASSKTKSLGAELAYSLSFAEDWTLQTKVAGLLSSQNLVPNDDNIISLHGMLSLAHRRHLTVSAEGMWGRESFTQAGAPLQYAQFYGVAAWFDYRFLSWLAGTVRYDFFADPRRVRGILGVFPTVDSPAGITERQQITLGVRLIPFKEGTIRLEYTADFIGPTKRDFPAPSIVEPRRLSHRLGITGTLAF